MSDERERLLLAKGCLLFFGGLCGQDKIRQEWTAKQINAHIIYTSMLQKT